MQRQLPLGFFLLLTVLGVLVFVPVAKRAIQNMKALPKPTVKGADMVYFFSPHCSSCKDTGPLVERLKKQRPDWKIVEVSTSQPGGMDLLNNYADAYNLSADDRGLIPSLFFDKSRRSVIGEALCRAQLMAFLSEKISKKTSQAKSTQ